jgi:hypothetical protein
MESRQWKQLLINAHVLRSEWTDKSRSDVWKPLYTANDSWHGMSLMTQFAFDPAQDGTWTIASAIGTHDRIHSIVILRQDEDKEWRLWKMLELHLNDGFPNRDAEFPSAISRKHECVFGLQESEQIAVYSQLLVASFKDTDVIENDAVETIELGCGLRNPVAIVDDVDNTIKVYGITAGSDTGVLLMISTIDRVVLARHEFPNNVVRILSRVLWPDLVLTAHRIRGDGGGYHLLLWSLPEHRVLARFVGVTGTLLTIRFEAVFASPVDKSGQLFPLRISAFTDRHIYTWMYTRPQKADVEPMSTIRHRGQKEGLTMTQRLHDTQHADEDDDDHFLYGLSIMGIHRGLAFFSHMNGYTTMWDIATGTTLGEPFETEWGWRFAAMFSEQLVLIRPQGIYTVEHGLGSSMVNEH